MKLRSKLNRCGDCQKYQECNEEIIRFCGHELDPDETYFEVDGCKCFKSKEWAEYPVTDRKRHK